MNYNNFNLFQQLTALAQKAGYGADADIMDLIEVASLTGDKDILNDLIPYLSGEAIQESLTDPLGFGKPSPEDLAGTIPIGTELLTGERFYLDFEKDFHMLLIGMSQMGKSSLLTIIVRYCLENK